MTAQVDIADLRTIREALAAAVQHHQRREVRYPLLQHELDVALERVDCYLTPTASGG
jgi:hypothetical protein